jgi:hypothetical protein
LTDGPGRLSGYRSKAYEGYAKRTMKRALAATRTRYKLARMKRGQRFRMREATTSSSCLRHCVGLHICSRRRRARVVMERSAKPFTPVQFRASPPRIKDLAESSAAKLSGFSSISPAVRSVTSSLCCFPGRQLPAVWIAVESTSVIGGPALAVRGPPTNGARGETETLVGGYRDESRRWASAQSPSPRREAVHK